MINTNKFKQLEKERERNSACKLCTIGRRFACTMKSNKLNPGNTNCI